MLDPEWAYRVGYNPFTEAGADVFLCVSPNQTQAFVADAEVITQITTRRNDFPKPLHMYGRLNIYGRNVVSTEGSDWRMHRKLTAPSFSDKNNELVFLESLHHAQSLLRLWTGPGGSGNKSVIDPAIDTMRFALYVISRAGFGVRVAWPHEEEEQQAGDEAKIDPLLVGSKIPPGHKMNYREALSVLLENIMWTQIGPPEFLCKLLPSIMPTVHVLREFQRRKRAERAIACSKVAKAASSHMTIWPSRGFSDHVYSTIALQNPPSSWHCRD